MSIYERLILENQIAVMWALIVDMADDEIKKDLEIRIELTESAIKELDL